MQILQQELDPSQQGLTSHDHPVLRELMADQATAYAEEVRLLRQRVAVLESELAAAKAPRTIDQTSVREAPPLTSVDNTSPCHTNALPVSEFTETNAPAVVAVKPAPTASEPNSDPGFAQAWTSDEEASFEERVAEKAFFQASSVDEQSRNWLLNS